MFKKILVVESDSALAKTLRSALEAKGFEVSETADGKGAVEQVRRDRPQLVVLAVDLSAGQNGYLICGKLKKDEDLKNIPVVIVGNPEGFAQHRKLKAHADDYVAKPVDTEALIASAGGLIGFPEPPPPELVEEDDSLSGLEETVSTDFGAEEISLESAEATVNGDPELDLLDAAFEDISEPPPAPDASSEEDNTGLSALEAEPEVETFFDATVDEEPEVTADEDFRAEVPPSPAPRASPPPPPPARLAGAGMAPGELRSLRARVSELESTLADIQADASASADRVRELESELETRTTELEAARASGGKNDKETFALRDAANRKDKEILRLKTELNEKDQELVELRDREMQLEQSASGSAEEFARRDAQIRTLTSRSEQLANEKKRAEQQLAAARDEARSAAAQLSALQMETDQFQASQQSLQEELEGLRTRASALESELDAIRGAEAQAEEARRQLEEAQRELETHAREAARYTEEADGLRRRVTELEEAMAQHEERVAKLYGRIKNDEKLRERTKKAVAIALQLLEEQPIASEGETDTDEEAAA